MKETDTENKLTEAKFFLDKLKESYSNVRDFDHYLNAYLSSARSVCWVMKKEFSDKSIWEEWYNSTDPSDLGKSILKKINKLRIETIHEKSIKSTLNITATISKDDLPNVIPEDLIGKKSWAYVDKPDTDGNQYFYTFIAGKFVKGKIDKTARKVAQVSDDIYQLCWQYYKILEFFVKEGIKKYLSL